MRKADSRTKSQLLEELEQLRTRLDEAEQTLHAIRSGEVDALVVEGPQGDRVFSLTGADRIYRVIAETMHEAALTVDLNGTILFCNQRFCDLMKTPMNEALGRRVTYFVSSPQEQPLEKLLADVQNGPVQRRLTLRASDGTPVPVQLSASLIQENASTSICLLVSDLSELEASAKSIRVLREHEQALEESEQRFRRSEMLLRTVTDNCADAIFMKDRDGRILMANPATCAVVGKPAEQIIGRTDEEVYADPALGRAVMDNDRRIIESGKTEVVEEMAPGPSGPRVFLSTKTPYRDAEGRIIGLVGVGRDVTARKRAETALQKAHDELELRVQERTEEIRRARDNLEARVEERTAQLNQANKELESFSYSVSHDLRAPLRAITGFTRMVKEDLEGRLDEDTKRKLEVIQQNAERMGQLIEDLLALSRLGRMTMKRSAIDMRQLTAAVIAELKTTNAEKRIDVAVDDLPIGLGDPNLIRQVLSNLIGNAIKFTSRKEEARIEIRGRREGDENIYCVKDNGVGFDMTYYDRLFGVFQRLHSATEFEGTGVGLAIVHRIITRHGGRVWAEGKVNAGASFYFSLPAKNGQS